MGPLCSFWLLKPLPAWQQGAEPRADARHQGRDFILQLRQESVCLEDRRAPALPLSVWKQAGKAGLKLSLVSVGLQQDPQRVHTCPAGAGKGSEPCVGPTDSPKTAGSTRELSRAGWQKNGVVTLVAQPRCALCWGTHPENAGSASWGNLPPTRKSG